MNQQHIKFYNIVLALRKMDDIKFISYSIKPYIILIEYKDEPIQFIYDYHSGKLVVGFNFNYVKIENLMYELFEQKGIRYYLNVLIDLKIKEIYSNYDEIKTLMENDNIKIDDEQGQTSIAFGYQPRELYVTNYNNCSYDSDIRFMIDHRSLRWTINFYSHSRAQDFINIIDFREKGITHFLNHLSRSSRNDY